MARLDRSAGATANVTIMRGSRETNPGAAHSVPLVGSKRGIFVAKLVVGAATWAAVLWTARVGRSWPEFWKSAGAPAITLCAAGGFVAQVVLAVIEYRRPSEQGNGVENLFSQLMHNYLYVIFAQMSLTSEERISLYRHEGKAFIMIGRYAANPVYQKTGRAWYPDDQGGIGKAWTDGYHEVSSLPDPCEKSEAYLAVLRDDYGMPTATAERLTMRSRSLAAYSIYNIQGTHPVAVIVFESTRSMALDMKALREEWVGEGNNEGKRMKFILDVMKDCAPSPSFAKGRGY